MNLYFYFLLIITLSHTTFGDDQVRYDDYKVYRLTPRSLEAAHALKVLEDSVNEYDFWTSVKGVGYPVDVMVPPYLNDKFNSTIISKSDFKAEIYISDVQRLIDNEKPKARKAAVMEWTDYHRLEEINEFLKTLAVEFPTTVSVLLAGRSYEGRDILGVKVSYRPENKNRAVFIEANIHAREWITSAVATWILNELLRNDDAEIRAVAESHDWYFVPVFNPDGFEYTHGKERLWRKTRTPYYNCVGVDPNRNWGYHFNDGGSSANPCSETYHGPYAFSETSTRTLSEFIETIAPDLQAYISLHSYGQQLLIPYGYSAEHLENYDDLYSVGVKAIDRLYQRYNTEYSVGNIAEILYTASGGSMDWVKGNFGTPITYSYELRDRGPYGFVLPKEQILPCAEETLDSLLTILQEFDILEDQRKVRILNSTSS